MTVEVERSLIGLPTFRFGAFGVCAYCGDTADTVDHVIPLSYSSRAKANRKSPAYGPMTTACRPCNIKLNNKYFETFLDRCQFAKDDLERRVQPILWTQSQLERLDYTLRTMVENSIKRAIWWRLRADWYQSREFWLNIEPLLWQECLSADYANHNPAMSRYFHSARRMIQEVIYRGRRH